MKRVIEKMRIIDFHTHCFPPHLAPKALSKLSENIHKEPGYDGTPQGLIKKMDACGIDKSVVLNIATNSRQESNVNAFALSLLGDEYGGRLIPFGSVHPDNPNVRDTIKTLIDGGIKGIKIHPDYTGHMVDSDELKPIFAACCEYGLPIVIHAGWDPVSPSLIHAPPEKTAKVLGEFPGLRLVAAHMGGTLLWEDVLRYLAGKDIWFDTSLACEYGLNPDLICSIIDAHPKDKILFGSDGPWSCPTKVADYIRSLGLGQKMEENIFYKNAEALLGITAV